MEKTESIYKVGRCLIPLTIQMVRQRYLDGEKCRRIEYFSVQCSADRLRILEVLPVEGFPVLTLKEEYNVRPDYMDPEDSFEDFVGVEAEYFRPNGTLCEGFPWENQYLGHRNWLQKGELGPYKPGQTSPFFWIDGLNTDGEQTSMQVAAGPLNVVCQSTINSVWLWVLE
jgi:hypothetical protein